MKSIIVARVSTEEQREAGSSLPAQVNRMTDYCGRHKHEVIQTYSFDESAYKEKRDEFDRILDDISKSKEKIAVCFDKVDRLSRNIFDKRVAVLYEKAIADEIELHFVSDGQVINNAMNAGDKFAFGMKLGLAKYYSDAIGDNVKRVFEQKRKDGFWIGTAPFGYDNVPRDKEKRTRADLIVNEKEARYVKEIFNLYESGNHSLSTICDYLNSKDVTTKKGKLFHTSALHHLICNPFYYGVMQTSYGEFPHVYKPLITKKQFLSVQRLLNINNNNPIKVKGTMQFAFGSGLLRCNKCDCLISAQIKKKKYVYYHCTNGKKTCERIYVPEKELDEQVKEVLTGISVTDKQIDEVCDYLKEHHDSQTLFHRNRIKSLQQEYDDSQARMDKALELLLDGKIKDDAYDLLIKKLTNRQSELSIELEELTIDNKNHHITARTILLLAQKALDLYENSEIQQKREILKLLFQNFHLDGKNLVYTLRKPFDSVFIYHEHPIMLRGQDSNL